MIKKYKKQIKKLYYQNRNKHTNETQFWEKYFIDTINVIINDIKEKFKGTITTDIIPC